MATIPLPETLAAGLRELAALPEPAFAELVAKLRSIPAEIKQYRVFNDAEFDIPGLPDHGRSIKGAAFALLISRARRREPVDQFAADLIETVSSTPGFEATALDGLKKRTIAILNIESLDLVARAHNVLLENSHNFSSARIVSDLRPVFGDDVATFPKGMVLAHMLNVVFHNVGRRESFVVALDDKDIDHLLEVLERAKTKSRTLKETIAPAKITYIPVV